MNNISPQAYVDPKAKIGNNVTIYPFAYIEGDVEIGDDCVIYPYVSIMNGTRLGRGNKVYQNTVLGAEPQDFNYKGEITALEIGDENIIRENVVINRATYATGKTHIGNRNFLMEGHSRAGIVGEPCEVFGLLTCIHRGRNPHADAEALPHLLLSVGILWHDGGKMP